MKIGPLNELQLKKFIRLLDQHNAKYTTILSKDDLVDINRTRSYKPIDIYGRRNEHNDTFAYVEIEDSVFDLLHAELEKLGILDCPEVAPNSFKTEYICPECDFVTNKPGKCPTHQVELLESSYDPNALTSDSPSGARVGTILLVGFFVLVGLGYTIRYFILNSN